MTDDPTIDPDRLPDGQTSEPDVTRDVELGTASHDDFTAADTRPVADSPEADLRDALVGGAPPARRRAVLELARREPDPATVADLERALSEDTDDEVRQFAVEALAKLGADRSVLESALADPDPWVRAEGVVALKRTDAAAAVESFEDALEDPHPAVRRNALISLHHVRGTDAIDSLVAALDDPSDRVREWAVRLLARMDEERATGVVRRHLSTETNDVVREAAVRALDESPTEDPWDGAGTSRAGDHVLNRPPSR